MLFPNGEKPVTITLYKDCPFDNKYTDHLFRPKCAIADGEIYRAIPKVSMKTFLSIDSAGVSPRYPQMTFTGTYNFNYGNGLVTSVVLEVPSAYTDANYMLVETGVSGEEKYFFITNTIIISATSTSVTCKFELELDVIATYGDIFADKMYNIPVLTERKHCQRYAISIGVDDEMSKTTKPYCCDLASDEPINKNINPSIVKKVVTFKQLLEIVHSDATKEYKDTLDNMLWVYITTLKDYEEYSGTYYKNTRMYNGLDYTPVNGHTIAIPLVQILTINLSGVDQDSTPRTLSVTTYPLNTLEEMFDDTDVVDIRVSPYAPFHRTLQVFGESITYSGGTLTINATATDWHYLAGNLFGGKFSVGETSIIASHSILDDGGLVLIEYSTQLSHTTDVKSLYAYPSSVITTTTERKYENEPKCMMPPYMKYLLKSQYSDGVELYPQLQLSYAPTNDNYFAVSLNTYSLPYSLDTAISVFPRFNSTEEVSADYKKINYGLVSTPNYTIPVGENALKNFNQTQGQQYVTSKIAQGVTGGVGVGLGIVGMGISAINPVVGIGMVIGGFTSMVKSVADAESKYADLKNTPDSLNAMGNNFWHDSYVDSSNRLEPYVVIYECTPMEKEMFLDYFYEYGYNVQRCCYFNASDMSNLCPASNDYTDVYYTNKEWVDTRLFTRNIFNYIKLGEDISNKIKGIPPVVKKKLSSIFQNGIKLWSWFNKDTIIGNDIDDYLFKNTYENAEII